jgi:cbb3-type cytochrome oxidase subunit 3
VIIIIAVLVFVVLVKRRSIQNVEKYNTLVEDNEEQVEQTESYAKIDEENDTQ